MEFIGRQRELQTLANFYQSPQAGLLILYGRRRIGKTRLITLGHMKVVTFGALNFARLEPKNQQDQQG